MANAPLAGPVPTGGLGKLDSIPNPKPEHGRKK